MAELEIKEEPIAAETAEITEATSFKISDSDYEYESSGSEIEYDNKLTLLEISPNYPLSHMINNMVVKYLYLMEFMIKNYEFRSELAHMLEGFYNEIPYNMINKTVLDRLMKFRLESEIRTITLYRTILHLLYVIELSNNIF